jgi:hypothetical protein
MNDVWIMGEAMPTGEIASSDSLNPTSEHHTPLFELPAIAQQALSLTYDFSDHFQFQTGASVIHSKNFEEVLLGGFTQVRLFFK